MSFLIRNISGGSVTIDDVGITLAVGEEYDLSQDSPEDISQSSDLRARILAGLIGVVDPLEEGGSPSSTLATSQAILAINRHAHPNFRIFGGDLNQLDDVSVGSPITGSVLRYNGAGSWTDDNIEFGDLAGSPDIWVKRAGDTMTGDLLMTGGGDLVVRRGSPAGGSPLGITYRFTFDPATGAPSIRRDDVGGSFIFFPDAAFPQIIWGSNAANTQQVFLDADNDAEMRLNTLHVGPIVLGPGGLSFEEGPAGGDNIGIKAPPISGPYNLTLPVNDGSPGLVLTRVSGSPSGSLGWVSPLAASGVDRVQTIFVGKHGNDANTGFRPEAPKLTFGAAITAATALTPTSGNRISIICQDGGTYTEGFTIPSWVFVKAPNATFVGEVILSDDSEFVFQEISGSGGSPQVDIISKPAGTGTAWVTGEIVRAVGESNCIVNGAVSSIIIVRVRQLFVEDGTAILDNSTGEGHIHMDVEDLYINGTGTGIDRSTNTGIVTGRISHILEVGAGIGNATAIDISSGAIAVNVGVIDCFTAYTVSAAGTLNLFINEIVVKGSPESGQRIQASGDAVVNVIESDSFRWRNRTSNFTARRTEFVAVDTSGGPVTMNLPNPASNGDSVTFQDALVSFGTNNLTVDAGPGGFIDNGAGSPDVVQAIVLDISGTSGIFIYNESLSRWTFARIQEEVAFSPDNVIYVTKNGNDIIGTGSFSNPFLTIKRGVQEALAEATPTNPTTVKVLDGIYDEINPINITGTNSEFVQVQGADNQSTFARPTVNGQSLFVLSSNAPADGPALTDLTLRGQNNGGTDYKDVTGSELIDVNGIGQFILANINVEEGNIGINAGGGSPIVPFGAGSPLTIQRVEWRGTATGNTTGVHVEGPNARLVGDVVNFRNNTVGLDVELGANVEISNYEIVGVLGVPTGTGVQVSDDSEFFANGGTIRDLVLGAQVNDTSNSTLVGTVFRDNTTDFDQVDGTAVLSIQGVFSRVAQRITDGANISLNYIDTTSNDFIVGNAENIGQGSPQDTPGLQFRVRDFDGRLFIGDQAENVNAPTNTVGGSRTVNLIDTNGNFRIWRWQADPGLHPAFEWVKGVNTFIADDEGDAPILSSTAGTKTFVVDLSSGDYNDPLDPVLPGSDRTTLDTRIFFPGAEIRVNGTTGSPSNDGDYVVASSTYTGGSPDPETISVVVAGSPGILTLGAGGTMVFGGGAGRPDGVSTYVDDPSAAIAAGVGDVHWDMLLRETDSFAIRRRTGGAGKEHFRFFRDRAEMLFGPDYDPGGDPPLTLVVEGVTSGPNVNYLTIRNHGGGAGGPEIAVVAGGSPEDANTDIELIPAGTGTVTVPPGYEANVTDDSLITKAYFDANLGSPIGVVSPGAPVNSVQYNDAGSFGGDAQFTFDPTGSVAQGSPSDTGRVTIIGNNPISNQLAIGGTTQVDLPGPATFAPLYVEVDTPGASIDGIRVFFNRNAPDINGYIGMDYDGNTPNMVFVDEDDDAPYITFAVIGSPQFAGSPTVPNIPGAQFVNRFGGRQDPPGTPATATTGFEWEVNGVPAATLDTTFLRVPGSFGSPEAAAPAVLTDPGQIRYDTIGGQPHLTLVDHTRSKVLTVETATYLWAEAALGNNDWIQIGQSTDADSSYIMPYDATIVGVQAFCENDNSISKGINLWINTTLNSTLGSFPGTGTNVSFSDNTLDIDVSAGDRVRLRAENAGGTIQDTVVTLRIKWRAT